MLGFRPLIVLALAASLSACGGGSSGTTSLECGTAVTSAALTVAGPAVEVTADGAKALKGASIQAPAMTTVPAMPVTISCASDIVPAGYIALSPAVSFGPGGATSGDRLWEMSVPFKAALMPAGAHFNAVKVFVKRKGATPVFPAPVPNLRFDDTDKFASIASFRGAELATYQVAIKTDAATPKMRRYTNRVILGISMGGGGAAGIGLKNADKFDVIGAMVPEPGMDVNYFLRMVADLRFGGFCTAEDALASGGTKQIGMLCDLPRALLTDQYETSSTFEHLLYQKGEGVGLTLDRHLYFKGTRDFSRAYANVAMWNKDDTYLPPGVTMDWINKPIAERCDPTATPIKLKNFFDRRFNPNGDKDVITFCDGGQGTGDIGVWDPNAAQNDPPEIFMAVDVNGNGKRDSGEPIVLQQGEPFQDVGTDGKADKDEPGYDPVTNPDPDGDDFHYIRNPLGTENDFAYELGEPFEDTGIDGVMGKGCEQGSAADCWDHGEGDNKFTLSPNTDIWIAHDPKTLWAKFSDEQRARLDIYADAGIRDFLNSAVAVNSFFGSMIAKGDDGRIYDDFAPMTIDPSKGTSNIQNFDFSKLGKHVYVRYGNPDATQQEIELGDGRHVGTGTQIVNRIIAAFSFIASRYPQGDRESFATSQANFQRGLSFVSTASGRTTPFSLFVPPGYDAPANAGVRYPVVYFFHGYGMQPEDLVDLSSVFSNFMVSPQIPKAKRFPKFIIVYVDGSCRPGGSLPLPATGDQCEKGTFYTDSPRMTQAKMESDLFQLMNYVDTNYRTKGEETIPVVE